MIQSRSARALLQDFSAMLRIFNRMVPIAPSRTDRYSLPQYSVGGCCDWRCAADTSHSSVQCGVPHTFTGMDRVSWSGSYRQEVCPWYHCDRPTVASWYSVWDRVCYLLYCFRLRFFHWTTGVCCVVDVLELGSHLCSCHWNLILSDHTFMNTAKRKRRWGAMWRRLAIPWVVLSLWLDPLCLRANRNEPDKEYVAENDDGSLMMCLHNYKPWYFLLC